MVGKYIKVEILKVQGHYDSISQLVHCEDQFTVDQFMDSK